MEVFRFAGYQGPASVHSRAGEVLAAALARAQESPAELAFTANITARAAFQAAVAPVISAARANYDPKVLAKLGK